MVFNNEKQKKEQADKFASLEKRLETLENAVISKSKENAELKSQIQELQEKRDEDLERREKDLERRDEDLEELRDVVGVQNEDIKGLLQKCADLEKKNFELEKRNLDFQDNIDLLKGKQKKDLNELFKAIEDLNVLQETMKKQLNQLGVNANSRASFLKKGIEDLCQIIKEMSEQNKALMTEMDLAFKQRLQGSLTSTSTALTATNNNLLKHQTRLNEMSNMLPSLFQKVINIQVRSIHYHQYYWVLPYNNGCHKVDRKCYLRTLGYTRNMVQYNLELLFLRQQAEDTLALIDAIYSSCYPLITGLSYIGLLDAGPKHWYNVNIFE
jgi:chromosome segregation ATPase